MDMSDFRAKSVSRFEQLDRIAVGIYHLNLPAAGSHLHLIAEAHSSVSQFADASRQVLYLKHHSVPSAGLLVAAIGHLPGPGCAGTAEDEFETADRDLSEGGQGLQVQIEAQRLRIEGNRPLNLFDLIPNPPKPEYEGLVPRRIHCVLHCLNRHRRVLHDARSFSICVLSQRT